MTVREIQYSVVGYADQPASGSATLRTRDRITRVRIGLRLLAVSWAAAMAAVFIPVAHFVLVPGLVITGGVLFARELRRTHVVQQSAGRCPDCGHHQSFSLVAPIRFPHRCSCESCHRGLTLREQPR